MWIRGGHTFQQQSKCLRSLANRVAQTRKLNGLEIQRQRNVQVRIRSPVQGLHGQSCSLFQTKVRFQRPSHPNSFFFLETAILVLWLSSFLHRHCYENSQFNVVYLPSTLVKATLSRTIRPMKGNGANWLKLNRLEVAHARFAFTLLINECCEWIWKSLTPLEPILSFACYQLLLSLLLLDFGCYCSRWNMSRVLKGFLLQFQVSTRTAIPTFSASVGPSVPRSTSCSCRTCLSLPVRTVTANPNNVNGSYSTRTWPFPSTSSSTSTWTR